MCLKAQAIIYTMEKGPEDTSLAARQLENFTTRETKRTANAARADRTRPRVNARPRDRSIARPSACGPFTSRCVRRRPAFAGERPLTMVKVRSLLCMPSATPEISWGRGSQFRPHRRLHELRGRRRDRHRSCNLARRRLEPVLARRSAIALLAPPGIRPRRLEADGDLRRRRYRGLADRSAAPRQHTRHVN